MTDDTLHSRSAIVNKIETIPTAARHSSISKPSDLVGEEAALRAARDRAQAVYDAAQSALHEAQDALNNFYIQRAGLSVGTIVENRGQQFRVVSISVMADRPFVYGNPKLKNGSWGSRHRYVGMNFKIVETEA